MKSSIIILSIVLAATIISSCKKEKKCEAGTGGSVTLVAFPKHHSVPIYNQATYLDTVYLKFNTQELPSGGLSAFDTYFVGSVGDADVHCTGLKCGDYYIVATGFDTTINERVFGGIPFTITAESGEVDVNIPVVE